MSEHTSGPWRILDTQIDPNNVPRVVAARGGIAVMCVDRAMGDKGPSEKEMANARLIAAAPDLLAALSDALACLDESALSRTLTVRELMARSNARIAIAKATGKTA